MRIPAYEKFRWRGWEFKLSQATSTEAEWSMRHGKIRIRVIYRDIKDPAAPPEFSAFLHIQGLAGVTGGGVSRVNVETALAAAERDFTSKVISAMRAVRELKRGNVPEPDG